VGDFGIVRGWELGRLRLFLEFFLLCLEGSQMSMNVLEEGFVGVLVRLAVRLCDRHANLM